MKTKTVHFPFNDEMARAIVEGRKTVMRRPVVPQPRQPYLDWYPDRYAEERHFAFWGPRGTVDAGRCSPLWRMPCVPGDLLIGREACRIWEVPMRMGTAAVEYRCDGAMIEHRGRSSIGGGVAIDFGHELLDYAQSHVRWRPSVQMPDAAARIRRKVVSVTVERVHGITEEDAVREGFDPHDLDTGPRESDDAPATDEFVAAWDSIYARKCLGWDVNPWVWRIEFMRGDEE